MSPKIQSDTVFFHIPRGPISVLWVKKWVPKWNPLLGYLLLKNREAEKAGGIQNDFLLFNHPATFLDTREVNKNRNSDRIEIRWRSEMGLFLHRMFRVIMIPSFRFIWEPGLVIILRGGFLVVSAHNS